MWKVCAVDFAEGPSFVVNRPIDKVGLDSLILQYLLDDQIPYYKMFAFAT